jgi:hypothetical protein
LAQKRAAIASLVQASAQSDIRIMTPTKRKNEIKRITSNLPEVYNRFFFNTSREEEAKPSENELTKKTDHVTVTDDE